MWNFKTTVASPSVPGRDLTPTVDEVHVGAWRALLVTIYLACIIVGFALIFFFASAQPTDIVGLILANIGRSVLAAGILGLAYDLLVRGIARQDQMALMRRLSGAFGEQLKDAAGALRQEIARTPLQLDESLTLIDPKRRIEIVRRVLVDNIGSQEVAEATLLNVFNLAGDGGKLWKDTSHTVEFCEEEAIQKYGLIRLTDKVSYRTRLNSATFKAALLRSRGIMEMLQGESAPDAFWLVEKGFVESDGKIKALVNFQNFSVSQGSVSHSPSPELSNLQDGSIVIEYKLPEQLVGTEVKIEYRFDVVVDSNGPYLHVALPCPSVGLHILMRNHVARLNRVESRLFVPDSRNVERTELGNDVFEIRTSQVVLKGHGAVILLR